MSPLKGTFLKKNLQTESKKKMKTKIRQVLPFANLLPETEHLEAQGYYLNNKRSLQSRILIE